MRPLHRADVVVVGVAAMDLMAQVERLPQPDDMVLAQQFHISPGGAGANVAAALARLACIVTFQGKVGDDEHGRLLIQSLRDAGVNTAGMSIDRVLPTPTCFIVVDEKGARMIIALGNAAILETTDELDLTVIRRAKALYLSDVDGEVARTAAREAHRGGATVFYGPGGMIVSRGMANLSSLLSHIDVLIVSRIEAIKLVPGTTAHMAMQLLLRAGATIVIQTLGAEGALLASEDHIVHIPAPIVQTVVDTTGAGDAFAAGLIAAHIKGEPWQNAVRIGCTVAAMKIGHLGARAGLPAWKDVAIHTNQKGDNHASF